MKALSQLASQLQAIWKQLGLNQKVSVVVAAVAVLGALGALVVWSSRVEYGLLYGRLDEAEAAKVVAVLEELKIPHKVGQGGTALYVPKDKVHAARMALAARGLPRGEGGVGFEIFDKPNFGLSDFVQRANYLRALQGELARTISQLDEVEAARVMIVLPENRLLMDNSKRPTASVFVRVKGNTQLQPSAVNAIRFLVANAVEGLTPNNVTVVDNRGHVLSETGDAESVAGLTAGQLAARRNLEQYLAKKAEGMLEAVLGPGQAVVRVSAEINFDTLTRVEEKFDPDSQVARLTTVNDENTDTTSATGAGGVPGVMVNTGAETNSSGASPVTTTRTKKKTTDTQYEINKTVSNFTQLAGGIKRLSAAVFVATRYEGTGPNRKPVPRSAEELEKLRRIVQSALGIQTGDPTRKDEITLEEMPFNDQLGEVGQQLEPLAQKQVGWSHLQSWLFPALGVSVVAVFLRLLMRTPETPLALPVGQSRRLTHTAGGNGGGTLDTLDTLQPEAGRPLAALRGTAPDIVTVETLNRLVRENPVSVSQAIQQWLNRTSPTASDHGHSR
jgi:flagellar M-ring protein FliF